MRQGCLHAARFGAEAVPADQWVEPDDPAAPLSQAPHLGGEPVGLAGVVAVRDDHDRGARIDHPPRVPAIERGQAVADAGAATDALRHQAQSIDRPGDVAVAQRRRHMRQPRVKDERLGLAEGIDDPVQEAHEKRGVEVHRAGSIEQDDEPQRLRLAAAPDQIERRSALRHAAMDGAADVEPPSTPAGLLAANEPRPHRPRQARRQRVHLGDLVRIDDVADVRRSQALRARGAFAPSARIGVVVTVGARTPLDLVGETVRRL